MEISLSAATAESIAKAPLGWGAIVRAGQPEAVSNRQAVLVAATGEVRPAYLALYAFGRARKSQSQSAASNHA